MKKWSWLAVVIVGVMLLFSGVVVAKVSGPCVNCHTMHNSQGGSPMNYDESGDPNKALTRGDCLGCHGQNQATNLINSIPQVLHTATIDLPGGNFAYITGSKDVDSSDSAALANPDCCGHNVVDIGELEDNSNMFPPPGDEFDQTGIKVDTFTCAGTYGCHGRRDVEDPFAAISGAHHTDDSFLKFGSIDENSQGGDPGSSYRFLVGVKGGEEDWSDLSTSGESSTVHNEYKGATSGVDGTATSPGNNTISGLCAECHGDFHGSSDDIGSSSPWLRHPTDIVLPGGTGKEYYKYNGGDGSNNPYSVEAPVARVTIPTDSPSQYVNPGTNDAIVMCLSCHRAHASANADLLRWNYEDINAGSGTDENARCFICHTSKDGVE